jgi:hypothetical protein
MDVGDHFELEHLYLTERTCRVCGQTKDLIDGFYRTKKKKYNPSSYSYECKSCTISRVMGDKKKNNGKNIGISKWEYPDW